MINAPQETELPLELVEGNLSHLFDQFYKGRNLAISDITKDPLFQAIHEANITLLEHPGKEANEISLTYVISGWLKQVKYFKGDPNKPEKPFIFYFKSLYVLQRLIAYTQRNDATPINQSPLITRIAEQILSQTCSILQNDRNTRDFAQLRGDGSDDNSLYVTNDTVTLYFLLFKDAYLLTKAETATSTKKEHVDRFMNIAVDLLVKGLRHCGQAKKRVIILSTLHQIRFNNNHITDEYPIAQLIHMLGQTPRPEMDIQNKIDLLKKSDADEQWLFAALFPKDAYISALSLPKDIFSIRQHTYQHFFDEAVLVYVVRTAYKFNKKNENLNQKNRIHNLPPRQPYSMGNLTFSSRKITPDENKEDAYYMAVETTVNSKKINLIRYFKNGYSYYTGFTDSTSDENVHNIEYIRRIEHALILCMIHPELHQEIFEAEYFLNDIQSETTSTKSKFDFFSTINFTYDKLEKIYPISKRPALTTTIRKSDLTPLERLPNIDPLLTFILNLKSDFSLTYLFGQCQAFDTSLQESANLYELVCDHYIKLIESDAGKLMLARFFDRIAVMETLRELKKLLLNQTSNSNAHKILLYQCGMISREELTKCHSPELLCMLPFLEKNEGIEDPLLESLTEEIISGIAFPKDDEINFILQQEAWLSHVHSPRFGDEAAGLKKDIIRVTYKKIQDKFKSSALSVRTEYLNKKKLLESRRTKETKHTGTDHQETLSTYGLDLSISNEICAIKRKDGKSIKPTYDTLPEHLKPIKGKKPKLGKVKFDPKDQFIEFKKNFLDEIMGHLLKILPNQKNNRSAKENINRNDVINSNTQENDKEKESTKASLELRIRELLPNSDTLSFSSASPAAVPSGEIWFTIKFDDPQNETLKLTIARKSYTVSKTDFLQKLKSRIENFSDESGFVKFKPNRMELDIKAIKSLRDVTALHKEGFYNDLEKLGKPTEENKANASTNEVPPKDSKEEELEGEDLNTPKAPIIQAAHPFQIVLDLFTENKDATHFFSSRCEKMNKKETITCTLRTSANSITLGAFDMKPEATQKILTLFTDTALHKKVFSKIKKATMNKVESEKYRQIENKIDHLVIINTFDDTVYISINKTWLTFLEQNQTVREAYSTQVKCKIMALKTEQPLTEAEEQLPNNPTTGASHIFFKPKSGTLQLLYANASDELKQKIAYHHEVMSQTNSASTWLLHIFTIIHLLSRSKESTPKQQAVMTRLRNNLRHLCAFEAIDTHFNLNNTKNDALTIIESLNEAEAKIKKAINPTKGEQEKENVISLWTRFISLLNHDDAEIEHMIVVAHFVRNHTDYEDNKKNLTPPNSREFMIQCSQFFGHSVENLNANSETAYQEAFETALESLKSAREKLNQTKQSVQCYKT